MGMTTPLYFEDIAVGQTFSSGTVTVETDRIKAFAADSTPAVPSRRGRRPCELLGGLWRAAGILPPSR